MVDVGYTVGFETGSLDGELVTIIVGDIDGTAEVGFKEGVFDGSILRDNDGLMVED